MKFIKFPDKLYKDCPQYVPAIHSDQVKSLTKVSTLSYCKRKMWMVMDGKTVVGRICGMINPRYNALYGKKRARFGWFDTIDDFEVAKLLLGTAETWAKENGMNEIHGPLYYNTLGTVCTTILTTMTLSRLWATRKNVIGCSTRSLLTSLFRKRSRGSPDFSSRGTICMRAA